MICSRGGVGALALAFWLLLWLSSFPPFELLIPVADAAEVPVPTSNMCVHLGLPQYVTGGYSIGAERFRFYLTGLMGANCFHTFNFDKDINKNPFKKRPWDNWTQLTCADGAYDINWNLLLRKQTFCDHCGEEVVIRTHLVKQHGRVLRGWLHFEVELTGTQVAGGGRASYIFAQMEDENFNAVGEFVTDEQERCGRSPNNPEILSPSQYQYLPCAATSPQEAKTSQAVFVPHRDQYPLDYYNKQVKDYIPDQNLSTSIHFTWRLNEYWCNRHQRFRLRAMVLPYKNTTAPSACYHYGRQEPPPSVNQYHCRQRRVTTPWIHPKWFGAADIKLVGPLNCSTNLFLSEEKGKREVTLDQGARSWIDKARKVTVEDDNVDTKLWKGKVCTVYNTYPQNQRTFGGRCPTYFSEVPTPTTFHVCTAKHVPSDFPEVKFENYTEYLSKLLRDRELLCSKGCRLPNSSTDEDLINIQSFPTAPAGSKKRKPTISYETVMNARTEQRADTLFYTRKYHGNLMILITMFLLPNSNLLIRYYKETFMHHLAMGCAPWFWFHMGTCFWVPTLYHSGYASMEQSIDNFGKSQSAHASFHRGAGQFFLVLFYLMMLFGAFRPLIRGARMISMAIHSVTGFLLYFLAIILIINSTYIPASPTVDHCDTDGLPAGFSFTAWMAVAWLIIDLFFHFFLTILQFAIDKQHDIQRAGCGFPFVPLLPAESYRDLVGSKFRKVALLIYFSLSLLITFTTMTALFFDDDRKNCSLGEMTCDLKVDPFGCYHLSKKYYHITMKKYELQLNST